MSNFRDAVRTGHDAVARPYADRFASELDHKPLDRALLAWFAGLVAGAGERSPYVPHEYASTRGYVLARRRP